MQLRPPPDLHLVLTLTHTGCSWSIALDFSRIAPSKVLTKRKLRPILGKSIGENKTPVSWRVASEFKPFGLLG